MPTWTSEEMTRIGDADEPTTMDGADLIRAAPRRGG